MNVMQVIPAIDIMNGRSVRLLKGVETAIKDYCDPMEAASRWAQQGADIIHVVDLDAALGRGSNRDLVSRIVKEAAIEVQVGGGIRSLSDASKLLESGASRVILGSLAFREPETIEELLSRFGEDRVVVSLDHSSGMVRISGWRTDAGISVGEAFDQFRGLGVSRFLVTCIDKDGTMDSPDVDTVRGLATSARIISAGGIGGVDDIRKLRDAGVEAAVVGKALYEGRITLEQAMEAAQI